MLLRATDSAQAGDFFAAMVGFSGPAESPASFAAGLDRRQITTLVLGALIDFLCPSAQTLAGSKRAWPWLAAPLFFYVAPFQLSAVESSPFLDFQF